MFLLVLTGCASNSSVQEQAEQHADPKDPFESVNRELWDFNYDVLDKHVLRPVTVAYVDYMPGFARTGLLNMAENLEEPANTVNNLLQGKVDDSLVSIGRFVLNSTVGILGAFDVATEIGLEVKDEDFGEVLGVYGVETGPYLMIPALGPNDVRSGAGDIVDSAYFPLADLNFYLSFMRAGIKAIETRAALIEQEQMLEQSLDPYTFVKNAYFQNLTFKVTDGQAGEDEVPEMAPNESEEELEEIDALLDEL
ncbi:VacJ family lipoprotein [Aestuariibacter sp. AA17]|uniref:VacJ family lipoprotein n=1 Tax=Fluctibacter corallii TaxID=2984329 RepID=A0ABT3A3N8_9ALTE|nr:VacJ family lipoprotein [Aestuariibacter sp. AA17]MCV2883302.1 VacJ family lipoprotein [Aestuariibacter sp. AA17]